MARNKILCVGYELALLRLRCQVLGTEGYRSMPATFEEAGPILTTENFDLVIMSSQLGDAEKTKIRLAAGDTPTLFLDGLVMPGELFTRVKSGLRDQP